MNKLLIKLNKKIDRAYGCFSVMRHGFWFVDIPRTSSTSIRSELGNHFGRAYGKRNMLERQYATKQTFPDHMPAREMRALLGNTIWNKIYTFAMVRNPWDRTYSMYHYRLKVGNIPKEWSFRDYVIALGNADSKTQYFEYHGFRFGASEYVLDENDKIIVDFIAKFETRSHDLKLLKSNLKIGEFGNLNIQGAKPKEVHYSIFYDYETRDIIQRLFSKDIELFGYEFEDLT